MGQKRDRVNGALKKAFAEKNGKSLRWAQLEAAKDSPAWRAFLAEQFPPSPAKADGGGGEGAPMEAAGRPRFYEAWDEWAREWNRRIDDLNAEINGLLNHV